MSAPNYIVDNKLPLSQDFATLRQKGLDYIQQYSGSEWTNLNASDPGITILDQVCFALTELGYCNDFPIADILTGPDGHLDFDDQFYLPENILTTEPVTPRDYVKYLIDGVEGVENAIIIPATTGILTADVYEVYQLIDRAVTAPKAVKRICKAAFYYLNASRNLGQMFKMPAPLSAAVNLITGTIEIASESELDAVFKAITDNISNYIFPGITQSGYNQLVQDGLDTNEVFNGPLLQKGWIPATELKPKRDSLNTVELTNLVLAAAGVRAVSKLAFSNPNPQGNQITCMPNQILTIDLAASRGKGLNILCRGADITDFQSLKPLAILPKALLAEKNIQLGAAVQVQTGIPEGKYRDINSYYSIQNTFPEIFAVGADAVTSNATDFQIARSRQLKGYLTLFDQVIANQFSQLANLGRLFSFKNTLTGTPSTQQEYYAAKDRYEIDHPEYPVPYLTFSPTYFYQPLYDVPHIRPLLKDNGVFNYGTELESEKERVTKSWEAYKTDPYNPYVWGLMDLIEHEKDNLTRREAIVDHLLARHGESIVMLNTIIRGSVYTGDSLTDRVIFKSLYLQNLGLLSYHRQKACNFLGANKIRLFVDTVPTDFEQRIFGGYQRDFIFNSDGVDHAEKLTEQDFVNYSAIELRLNMLFGLKALYSDYIAENYKLLGNRLNLELAYWLIKERRGVILVETGVLLELLLFEVILSNDPQNGPYYQVGENLDYGQTLTLVQTCLANTQVELNEQLQNGKIPVGSVAYTITAARSPGQVYKCYQWIPQTDYFITVRIRSGNEVEDITSLEAYRNRIDIILPAFVPQFKDQVFKDRLDFFLQNTLPVTLNCKCTFVDTLSLNLIIPGFALWHNAMRFHHKHKHKHVIDNQSRAAGILSGSLEKIYKSAK